jgi:hypothetical protein
MKKTIIIITGILIFISCNKDNEPKLSDHLNIEGKWYIKKIEYTYIAIDTPTVKPTTGTFAYNDGNITFNSDSTGTLSSPVGIFYTEVISDRDSFKWSFHTDTLILIRNKYTFKDDSINSKIKDGIITSSANVIYCNSDSMKLEIPGYSLIKGYTMYYTLYLAKNSFEMTNHWTELSIPDNLKDSCGCSKTIYNGYVKADSFTCSIFTNYSNNWFLLSELETKSGSHSFIFYNKQNSLSTLIFINNYSTAYGSICNLPLELKDIDFTNGRLIKIYVKKYEPCKGDSGNPLLYSYFDIVLTKLYILN